MADETTTEEKEGEWEGIEVEKVRRERRYTNGIDGRKGSPSRDRDQGGETVIRSGRGWI